MSSPAASKLCPSCGTSNPIDANLCYKCGRSFNRVAPVQAPPLPNAQGQWQQPPSYAQYPRGYQPSSGPNTAGVDGMAIASLVLGIVSLLGSCILCLALPLGAISLILGGFGLRGTQRGIATAGMVLGGIAIIATFILSFALFAG